MKKILFLLALGVTINGFSQNPKKHFKTAQKLYKEQQVDEAINELNQAISLDENFIDAYVLRGEIFESKKDYEKAVSDYEKAADVDKTVIDNLFNAGRLNYMVKDYTDAAKYLKEASILDGKNFPVLQYKALTHIKLKEFHDAVLAIDNAININDTYLCHYIKAVANDSLNNYQEAIADYNKVIEMNAGYSKAHFAISLTYVNAGDHNNALIMANKGVEKFGSESRAFDVRSQVYHARNDLANAINDLSKVIAMEKDNTAFVARRGKYYFEFEQYQNARSDFDHVIEANDKDSYAFFWRGRSNEELIEKVAATADYKKVIKLSDEPDAPKHLKAESQKRIFEMNREQDAPIVVIDTPMVINDDYLAVLNNADRLTITGKIDDASDIDSLSINDLKIKLGEDKTFEHNLSIADIKTITINVIDVYGNDAIINYSLKNVEVNLPVVYVTNPIAGDNNEIYLDSKDDNLFIEGRVEDESTISDIYINGVRASFNDTEINPTFTAAVSIFNKNKITIKAVDVYNNEIETSFTLNREGAQIAEGNPMGKTWVVFIENSNYESFASLEGPTKDVATMKGALSGYQIHNFIHKKDMSKKDFERFFSIELRDQVKKNNVNSLMVWYAGHGKFINETGYWIPVDAVRDDEFTYFNINALKAGMQSYSALITHVLVVTDACESGPSFYQAMRDDQSPKSCDDVSATKFKSSQVFSSAGYELASDDSQFTKTFAKSLQFNDNACMPIESVVINVTKATQGSGGQKPQFGKIAGFEDENGTFFFIKK